MESDAEVYSKSNKPQYDVGCDFVRFLKVCEGYKVLDMGCGTGDVSNFIASLVGPQGEVVGVDPDEARIKIAKEKFKDAPNLTFLVGDSSSKLPHGKERYYDLHFSSSVFHWLIGDEKKVYIKQAYECLKQGGRIAFVTGIKSEISDLSVKDIPMEFLSEEEYKKMCQDHGFVKIATQILPFVSQHSNYEEFETWFRGSAHRNLSDCDPAWVKLFLDKVKVEANGSVKMEVDGMIRVIAEKQSD